MIDISNRIFYALANRALPTPTVENVPANIRSDRYGNLITAPVAKWRNMAAREGTYWSAHNATNDAATTLAGHAAPVLVDADATMTKPFIHLVNNGADTTKLVELDYIEIEVITAGATGSADSWADQLDTGSTRITTAGTALTVVNSNMQVTAASLLSPTGGVIVVGAESTKSRNLGFGQFRPSIQVAGDKYMFVYGGDPETAGIAGATATINRHVITRPPVVLGPTDFYMLALYSPSQNAAGVYKVRMGWVER
jgi:hypothetical protein